MSSMPRIINGISNTNNFREGVLALSDGTARAAALCLKLERRVSKDTGVTLDLLRKQLTCFELH